jgi:Phage tail sheath protein subtilisin-like domain/Phage tail sheath C-terminal domain
LKELSGYRFSLIRGEIQMAYQLSPGVEAREWDLTGIVPGVATTEGAFAGDFAWGPVDEIVMVSNETELVARFGKPTNNNFVDFFTCANFLAYARNLKVVRGNGNSATSVANTTSGVITIKNELQYEEEYYDGSGDHGSWAAKYPGSLGNSLKVSSCPSSNAYSATHSLTANATSGSRTVVFSDVLANDVTRMLTVGDFINIGGTSGTGFLKVDAVSGNTVTLNTAPTANFTAAVVNSKWAYADEFDAAPGTSEFAAGRNSSGDEMHIIIIDEDGKFTGIPNTVLEKFAFVSKASDAQSSTGVSSYYRDVIKNESKYIWWMDHQAGALNWGSPAAGTTYTPVKAVEYVSLAGGSDFSPSIGQKMLAYDKFKNEDELDISFIMLGGHGATVAIHVINNVCEYRKDCIALISPDRDDVVNNDGDEVNDILAFRNMLPSSSYAFLTDNWKYQFDKYNNTFRWVPDNGDIGGIMARSDFDTDPWYSPAGLNRGQVKNVIKIAWNSNKSERDELYKKGVNSVVTWPAEGTVLWGDKTLLAKPSAFDRINVRRLFIVLRKAISKAARYTLFELNDRFTRAQFVALVEPFLRDVQGRRGLYDFKVVCDETNNTPVVIDRNEFIGDIYIKPARSINFITLNFVAVATGASFEEVVGQFN